MEYLVESHLGGYYISDKDPSIITKHCSQCGDSDWILLSIEKNKKLETLQEFFSIIKLNKEEIENEINEGASLNEIIDYLIYNYDNDITIIKELFENKYITQEELLILSNQVNQTEQIQLEIIRQINNGKKLTKNKVN